MEDLCVKRKKSDSETEVLRGPLAVKSRKSNSETIVELWLEGAGTEGGKWRDIDEKVYFSYKMNKT